MNAWSFITGKRPREMNCVRKEFRHSESRLYRSLLAHEDEIITLYVIALAKQHRTFKKDDAAAEDVWDRSRHESVAVEGWHSFLVYSRDCARG